jgi:hypothetical protein
MTVSTITVDRRKLIMGLVGGLAAATTGIAIAAPITVDPIYAAIAAHREAVNRLNTAHAKLVAEGLTDSNSQPVGAALMATFGCSAALIDTVPTTREGLRALESYLLEDGIGPRMARQNIRYPRTVEGITFTSSDGSPESVAWLIGQRAAELYRG